VIGQDGPSKTMSSKADASLEMKEVVAKPGPGAYDPNPESNSKAAP